MPHLRTTNVLGRSGAPALNAARLLAGSWLGTSDNPTAAAFPGKNGRIAFNSDRTTPGNPEEDSEIHTMKPDGSDLTQFTFNAAADFQPAWSPKGKWIASTGSLNGNEDVYTMSAGGSDQTNRTKSGVNESTPDWQPRPRR